MTRAQARPVVAFFASFALALPAGWRALEADPPGAPASRPPLSSVQVGDVRVELAVERATVAAGEDVAVRLTAFSSPAAGAGPSEQPGASASAEVEISMLERVSRSMGRNPMPALMIGERRRITLQASAMGTTIDLRFKTDRPSDAIALAGSARTFTILVKPVDPKQPGKVGKVEESEGGLGFQPLYAGLGDRGNTLGDADNGANVVVRPPNGAPLPARWRNFLPQRAIAPGSAAMAVVTARVPPAYRLTLGAPPALEAGKTARLALKVKNLTQATLKELTLPVYGLGFEQVGTPARLARLAPGAEVTVELRIKATIDNPRPAVTVSGYAALGGSAGTQVQADASGKLAVTEVAALSLDLGL